MANSELTIKAVREMGMAMASKLYKMFESGKCDDMSIDQVSRFADMIVPIREVRVGEAARIAECSLGKFYRYINAGLIHKPRKTKGGKVLLYNVDLLKADLKKIREMNPDDLKAKLRIGDIISLRDRENER